MNNGKKIILGVVIGFIITGSALFSTEIKGPIAEYEAKSIFLFKVCKFVQWPEQSQSGSNPYRPIIINVLGKLPEGSKISIPANKTIEKRHLLITPITELQEIDNSDVLFIASSEAYRINEILDRVGDKPILTVGDTKGFCKKGVIINLFIHNNRIAFEFNLNAAKKARIQLDSYLYIIGISVPTEEDRPKK